MYHVGAMDTQRHTLLGTLQPNDGRALHRAAVGAGITVNTLVNAVLGRVEDAGTVAVAKALPLDLRSRVAKLDWPWDCPFCGTSHDKLKGRCNTCGKRGCLACVTGKGCPPCAAEQQKKLDEAAAQADANQKLLDARRSSPELS